MTDVGQLTIETGLQVYWAYQWHMLDVRVVNCCEQLQERVLSFSEQVLVTHA